MSVKERTESEIKKGILTKYSGNDERQTAIVNNAAVVTVVLTLFLVIGKMVVTYFMTKDVETWDIVLLLFIIIVFSLGCRKDKTMYVPKEDGKELINKEDKKNRIKQYAKDAITFSIGMMALEAIGYFVVGDESIDNFRTIGNLSPTISYIICGLLIVIGTFIIALGVNYLLGEHSVKKYNKYLDKFDE